MQKKDQQTTQQHTAAEHNKNSTTRASSTPRRTAQRKNPAQHKHATQHRAKHKTHHTPQHHRTRGKTRQSTGHHNQPEGWGGSTTSAHPKKKTAQHPGGQRSRTTPHGIPQRGKTPHQRDQHNTHQRKAKQHDNIQRNRATPPQYPRAATGRKRRRRIPEDKAHKQGTRGSTRRGTPPARRHRTRATRKATTHREQAQPGSTDRHSASANRPLPGHNAHGNTHQHTPQPRRQTPPQHRTTGRPPREKKRRGKKKETNKKQEKGRQKNGEGGGEKVKKGEGGRGDNKTPRPTAPRAAEHGTPETTGAHKRKEKNKKHSRNEKHGNPSQEGAEQTKNAPGPATGKGEAHQNAPRRPTCLTRPEGARTRTYAWVPGVASSNPKGAVSASTRNSPGVPAESPDERRAIQETRRVSDRVYTRKPPQRTPPKTDAGGTRKSKPHRRAMNGYDTERAQQPRPGRGQRQAQ